MKSKQRCSMLRMDLRCYDVRMMQKRRRPLGERAGQLSNCPSELAQFSELIKNLDLSLIISKIILLFKIIVHIYSE